jgi:O-antigen/teichoic acid export membrane protein
MTLKQKTVKGVAWNTIGKISNQFLQFIISIILMRLLQPRDYGLIAMAMVFIGFVNIFTDFGFSAALIQRQNLTNKHTSSIFWINVIIGLILTLSFIVLAPFIAAFYNSSGLINVIIALSLTFFISSFGIVPKTLLQKEMNFALINKIEIFVVFITGGISIYLAFHGWGVWSLVMQYLSSQFIRVILLFTFNKWKPNFLYSKNAVKDLFSFSAYFTGFNLINYWARKSDDLLIGKFMSSAELGIYSRAYNLMLLPITQVINVIRTVMIPALSTVQEDKPRVKKIYLDVVQTIALITFPMMIGLIVTAEPFILGIFGAKWKEVIPVIQILASIGVLQTLGNPTGWIYISQGKTKWMFWWGIGASGSIITAIIIGVLFGSIISVSIAYLIINFLLVYPQLTIPGKLINMKFQDVYKKVIGILICSVLMAVIIFLTNQIFIGQFSNILKLIMDVVLGVLAYIFLIWIFKLEAPKKIFTLIKELKMKKQKL